MTVSKKSGNKVRVLQVVSALGMGGAETWLLELVRFWKEKGTLIENDFLITSGKRSVLDEQFEKLGCRIHYIALNKKEFVPFLKKFRRLLAEENYSAIHSHNDILSGWFYAVGIGRLPQVRVTHFHNPAYQWKYNYGVNARRRFILKVGKSLIRQLSTHIRGTSNELLIEAGVTTPAYSRLTPRSLHCAIDLPKWQTASCESKEHYLQSLGLPAKSKIILFAGRFDYSVDLKHPSNHKNSTFALEVFAEAAKRDPDLRFLMAGANEYIKDEFVKLLKSRGVEDKVRLLGIRKDLPGLMRASDLLLFPSRSEGLGMVAVEAQAAGVPVLASNGVPRECQVIPGMVSFLRLDQPISEWAAELLRMVNAGKPADINHRPEWEISPFALKNGAEALLALYSSGY